MEKKYKGAAEAKKLARAMEEHIPGISILTALELVRIFSKNETIRYLLDPNSIVAKKFLDSIGINEELSNDISALIGNENFIEIEEIFFTLKWIIEKHFPTLIMSSYRYDKERNTLIMFCGNCEYTRARVNLEKQKKTDYLNELCALSTSEFCFSELKENDFTEGGDACLPLITSNGQTFIVCFQKKNKDITEQANQDILRLNLIFKRLLIDTVLKKIIDNIHSKYIDGLTGLYNSGFLKEIIGKRKKRYSVIFIDINDFKRINDQFGHHKGNEVLQHLANSLSNCVRPCDKICRFGGDEMLILVESNDEKGIQKIKQRIMESTSTSTIEYTVSVSYSIYDEKEGLEETIRKAIDGLHQEKPIDGKLYRLMEDIKGLDDPDALRALSALIELKLQNF